MEQCTENRKVYNMVSIVQFDAMVKRYSAIEMEHEVVLSYVNKINNGTPLFIPNMHSDVEGMRMWWNNTVENVAVVSKTKNFDINTFVKYIEKTYKDNGLFEFNKEFIFNELYNEIYNRSGLIIADGLIESFKKIHSTGTKIAVFGKSRQLYDILVNKNPELSKYVGLTTFENDSFSTYKRDYESPTYVDYDKMTNYLMLKSDGTHNTVIIYCRPETRITMKRHIVAVQPGHHYWNKLKDTDIYPTPKVNNPLDLVSDKIQNAMFNKSYSLVKINNGLALSRTNVNAHVLIYNEFDRVIYSPALTDCEATHETL